MRTALIVTGALLVGLALAFLQQACGINVVIYYGSLIFADQAADSATSALSASVLIGLINLIFTLFATATLMSTPSREDQDELAGALDRIEDGTDRGYVFSGFPRAGC